MTNTTKVVDALQNITVGDVELVAASIGRGIVNGLIIGAVLMALTAFVMWAYYHHQAGRFLSK
jgi:hypothetical protein